MNNGGAESSMWRLTSKTCANQSSSDASFFSVSLPDLFRNRLNFSGSDRRFNQGIGDNVLYPGYEDKVLPEPEDDFDLSRLPTQVEDLDDDDVYKSAGGLQIENECWEISTASDINGNNDLLTKGELPSRTLFVRNISSTVEDSELMSLFEPYGDIRQLYTACKLRGFVMVSYYDLRAAQAAMHALQDIPLRRRKLDIHFSIPKDNPSKQDKNQGSMVIFNLEPLVSMDELYGIFGAYGEIKEIRDTPYKMRQKFIEYYDIRAAEAAMRALNGSEIFGMRIKIKFNLLREYHRSLMLQHNQELEPGTLAKISLHSMGTFSSPEFVWRCPTTRAEQMSSLVGTSSLKEHPLGQGVGEHPSVLDPHQYRVSAPSGMNVGAPSLMNEQAGCVGNCTEIVHPSHQMFLVSRTETANFRGGSLGGSVRDGTINRTRGKRVNGGSEVDGNKKYHLDPANIISGNDIRTTLMIKNIPNKYTSRMLIAAIDKTHKGAYDFLYLPIDFKNQCNMGYAFINMVSPSKIITFYEAFDGKKWKAFNSRKVASLAYARIQGRDALISHFQNSTLMREDKSCRPIVFQSPGQEHLSFNNLNIFIRQPDGSYIGDESLDS